MRCTRACRWLVSAECFRLPRGICHRVDRGACGGIADSGKQQQDAIPADFIARVFQYSQEGQHILDVSCFEEFESAPFLEWDFSVRELDLEISGHVTCAEEHRYLAQPRAFFMQLEDAIDDEARLSLFILRGDEPGNLAAFSLGPQVLRESLGRARDESIGDVEDRLGGTIVLL